MLQAPDAAQRLPSVQDHRQNPLRPPVPCRLAGATGMACADDKSQSDDTVMVQPHRWGRKLTGSVIVHQSVGLFKVTRGIAAKHPGVILLPTLVFAVLAALAIWATSYGERKVETQLRTQAQLLGQQVGNQIQQEFYSASLPVFVGGIVAKATPYWPQLQQIFERGGMDVAQTANVEAVAMAPLGMLSAAYPPKWASILLNASIINPDLLPQLHLQLDSRSNISEYVNEWTHVPDPVDTVQFFGPDGSPYLMLVQPVWVAANIDIGFNRSTPLSNCLDCDGQESGRKFWGMSCAVVSIIGRFPQDTHMVQPLRNGKYAYTAVVQAPGNPPFLFLNSMDEPYDAECIVYKLQSVAEWMLCLSPLVGWRQPWLAPVAATSAIVSAIIAALVFMMQLSRLRHQMLLQSLVPEQVLKQMHADNTFLQQPEKPAWQPGTAAGSILAMTDDILADRPGDKTAAVLVRNAVVRCANIYAVLDFGKELKQQDLDTDVAQALMRQLGAANATVSRHFEKRVDSDDDHPTSAAIRANLGQLMGCQRDDSFCCDRASEYSSLAEGLEALLAPRMARPTGHLHSPLSLADLASVGMDSAPGKPPTLVPSRAAARLRRNSTNLGTEPPARNASSPGLQSMMMSDAQAAIVIMSPPPPMMDQVEKVLASASRDFHFDAFALAEVTQGHPLSALAFYLFHTSGLISRLKLPSRRLARFLTTCEEGYRPNPYHNSTHAADVLQTYHVLLTKGGLVPGYADPLTLMACYLAAVVHDYEHLGKTNDYLINSSHPLAIMYNDKTPMENHHVAAAFRLLRQPECAFLAVLPKHDADKLRKLVIDLVLGTDMKAHFALITQFTAVHRTDPPPHQSSGRAHAPVRQRNSSSALGQAPEGRTSSSHTLAEELVRIRRARSSGLSELKTPVDDAERLLSLQIALKCADLGHICEGLQVHLRWVALLEAEFFAQGDKEKELGLPISPLFDRNKPGVTKSQVGFFSFVVLPLFQAFTRVFPGTLPALESTQANYAYWEKEAGKS